MSERDRYKIYGKPELQDASLVVGWSEDAANLGAKIIDYLNEELYSQEFCEIELEEFFFRRVIVLHAGRRKTGVDIPETA